VSDLSRRLLFGFERNTGWRSGWGKDALLRLKRLSREWLSGKRHH